MTMIMMGLALALVAAACAAHVPESQPGATTTLASATPQPPTTTVLPEANPSEPGSTSTTSEPGPASTTTQPESASTTTEPGPASATIETLVYLRDGEQELEVDVYVPAGEGPFPVVVLSHGFPGSKAEPKQATTAAAAAEAGMLTFVPN
jgi:predicted acyl esterase